MGRYWAPTKSNLDAAQRRRDGCLHRWRRTGGPPVDRVPYLDHLAADADDQEAHAQVRHQHPGLEPPRALRSYEPDRDALLRLLAPISPPTAPSPPCCSAVTRERSSSRRTSAASFRTNGKCARTCRGRRRPLRLAELLRRRQQRRAAPRSRLGAGQVPQDRHPRPEPVSSSTGPGLRRSWTSFASTECNCAGTSSAARDPRRPESAFPVPASIASTRGVQLAEHDAVQPRASNGSWRRRPRSRQLHRYARSSATALARCQRAAAARFRHPAGLPASTSCGISNRRAAWKANSLEVTLRGELGPRVSGMAQYVFGRTMADTAA